jgi:ketosteroid isomerase-like protein
MMPDDPYVPLWTIERGFWTGDAAFYQNNMTEDALIAFAPPHGLLPKAQAVASVAELPRWQTVELEVCRAIFISDCVVLLAYRACGCTADDGQPCAARVVSSYVKRRGRWMLVFQQHTPEGALQGDAAGTGALVGAMLASGVSGLAGTARPAPSA